MAASGGWGGVGGCEAQKPTCSPRTALLSPCRTHLEPEEGGLVADLVTTGRPRFRMGVWLRKS